MKRVLLLAAASVGLSGLNLLSTANADDALSLENRLKEFNQPAVVIEKVVSSKPKAKPVAKLKKVSKRSSSPKRKRRHTGACYDHSAATLRDKAEAFQPYIRANSAKYGVDEALIIAVITAESCFRQRARSPKSAQGLMQLIPATAKRFGVKDAYLPSQNIRGGTRYLKFLLKRFSGKLEFAIAGYNAGEGAVDRYSGIPPYRETKEYVRRVMMVYNRLKGRTGRTYVTSKPVNRAKAVYAVQRKSSKPRGNFIKPDYKWRKQQPRRVAVSARDRQQMRLVSQRNNNAYSCRDSSSPKIRRTTDLIKRTTLWRRFYTVKKSIPLSTISRQTGVGLNHLLNLNRGISRLSVKSGRKVLVWQCGKQ